MDNKKIRGWVVRILHRAYPAGLEGENLRKQLHDLGYTITKKDFDANITYLVEDGFVEKKTFGASDFDEDLLQNKIYKLTTKGVDLAEKSITDMGVDL
ncbi:MAG TPA: hypothetical protein DC000_02685 [Clostridiales bacterium]|nr:hypothetical protein [Clostridiales bacterium]